MIKKRQCSSRTDMGSIILYTCSGTYQVYLVEEGKHHVLFDSAIHNKYIIYTLNYFSIKYAYIIGKLPLTLVLGL